MSQSVSLDAHDQMVPITALTSRWPRSGMLDSGRAAGIVRVWTRYPRRFSRWGRAVSNPTLEEEVRFIQD